MIRQAIVVALMPLLVVSTHVVIESFSSVANRFHTIFSDKTDVAVQTSNPTGPQSVSRLINRLQVISPATKVAQSLNEATRSLQATTSPTGKSISSINIS